MIHSGTKEYEKKYEGDYEMFVFLFEERIIDEDVFEMLRGDERVEECYCACL